MNEPITLTHTLHEYVQRIEAGLNTREKLVEAGHRSPTVSLVLRRLRESGIIAGESPIRILTRDYTVKSKDQAITSRPEPIHQHVAKQRKCLHCGNGFKSEWAGNRVCAPCQQTRTWRGAVMGYSVSTHLK